MRPRNRKNQRGISRPALTVMMMLSFLLAKLSWETKLLLHANSSKRSLLETFTAESPHHNHQMPPNSFRGSSNSVSIASDGNTTTSRDPVPVIARATHDHKQHTRGSHKSVVPLGKAKKELIVFYHIFLPDEERGNRSTAIVAEQLEQIGHSGARNMSESVQVYYNTIGNRTIDEAAMNQTCANNHMQCVHTKHYTEGFEFHTLRDIRLYCRQEENINKQVVYIHNK
ncbi:expressed unknown protein (Partial), partial [Seminavis robusta]|eukprot:Sro4446_g354020.1 n/a (226) ;mRNA; r:59-737